MKKKNLSFINYLDSRIEFYESISETYYLVFRTILEELKQIKEIYNNEKNNFLNQR